MPGLKSLSEWLASIPRVPWELAVVLLLLLIVTRFLMRAGRPPPRESKACARCRDGYALRGLGFVDNDGRDLALRCSLCGSYFAKELAGPRVLKLDEGQVRKRWPAAFGLVAPSPSAPPPPVRREPVGDGKTTIYRGGAVRDRAAR